MLPAIARRLSRIDTWAACDENGRHLVRHFSQSNRILSQIDWLPAFVLLLLDIFHLDRSFPSEFGPFLPLRFDLQVSLQSLDYGLPIVSR